MKTIKELEELGIKGVGVIAYIKALKDVLELIDKRINKLKVEWCKTDVNTHRRRIINALIKELEQLKSRITGK